jgi:hypothetical protein
MAFSSVRILPIRNHVPSDQQAGGRHKIPLSRFGILFESLSNRERQTGPRPEDSMNFWKCAVNQSRDVLSQGRQLVTLPVVFGLGLILWIAGCASVPKSLDEIGPRFKPTNIYRRVEVMPPLLRRVAVLPLTSPFTTAELSAGVADLETILYAELEKSGRFEVTPLSPEQLRELTGQSSWRADEQLPANFLERLHEGTGCDAILFCQLIRYQPYEPLAIGWKFSLVEKGAPSKDTAISSKVPALQVLWSADEVFDAGDVTVATAARVYYSQHLKNEAPLSDSSTVLGSPSRFGQYTLNALFATLPVRQIH